MLDQACAHCPIFPTAASRRSLGRVSVPVWLIVLSDQLPIAGLVGLYPTNYLIGRRPLPRRLTALDLSPYAVLAPVSQGCPPPQDTFLRVTHPSAAARCRAARLACVKHAASVRSEPGSNSQVHHRATPEPRSPRTAPHPQALPTFRSHATPATPRAHHPAPDIPQAITHHTQRPLAPKRSSAARASHPTRQQHTPERTPRRAPPRATTTRYSRISRQIPISTPQE